jgi:hypothetical protein
LAQGFEKSMAMRHCDFFLLQLLAIITYMQPFWGHWELPSQDSHHPTVIPRESHFG